MKRAGGTRQHGIRRSRGWMKGGNQTRDDQIAAVVVRMVVAAPIVVMRAMRAAAGCVHVLGSVVRVVIMVSGVVRGLLLDLRMAKQQHDRLRHALQRQHRNGDRQDELGQPGTPHRESLRENLEALQAGMTTALPSPSGVANSTRIVFPEYARFLRGAELQIGNELFVARGAFAPKYHRAICHAPRCAAAKGPLR